MAKQTVADSMGQAMLSNVIEKFSSDNLNDVITEAKKYIGVFESGDKDVKANFGGTLGMLYMFQSLAFRVMSDEKNDNSLRQKSDSTAKKAMAIAEQHGEEDKEYANKLIGIIQTPEKVDRSLIQQFLDAAVPSGKSKKKSSSGRSLGDWIDDMDIKERLIATGMGILAIAAGVLFSFLMVLIAGWVKIGFIAYLAVVPAYVLIYAGLRGWDWYSQYEINTVGGFLKIMSFLILAFTGIGTIAVLYWIGNGTMDYMGWG